MNFKEVIESTKYRCKECGGEVLHHDEEAWKCSTCGKIWLKLDGKLDGKFYDSGLDSDLKKRINKAMSGKAVPYVPLEDAPETSDVVNGILDLFLSRKGFDYWWETIAPEYQWEIIMKLARIITEGS